MFGEKCPAFSGAKYPQGNPKQDNGTYISIFQNHIQIIYK